MERSRALSENVQRCAHKRDRNRQFQFIHLLIVLRQTNKKIK